MTYKIKNRNGNYNEIKESNFVIFLYNTLPGRLILSLINKKSISKIIGFYYNSNLSKLKIKSFITKNSINMEDYEYEKYNCFNAFFTRKIKNNARKIELDKNILISPCDCKLTAYKIDKNLNFNIKHSNYSIKDIIGKELSTSYKAGYALVFRLGVDDYHRYCFIDSGKIIENYHINGVLHTVRPIALEHKKVFIQNDREISLLETDNFGLVYCIEVGAIGVGKIVNHPVTNYKKGEEKGFFKFGGSTIILIIKDIEIDKDILENSNKNVETIIKYGEKIGKKNTN